MLTLQWWMGGGVQSAGQWLCGAFWEEPPAAERGPDQGDGGWPQEERWRPHSPWTPWERMEDYKYLGVNIDRKLNWKTNTEAAYKKGMSRLDFLRRLRSFGEQQDDGYFQAAVARARFFAVVCWGGSVGAATPTAWTNWSERLRVCCPHHTFSPARLDSLTTRRRTRQGLTFLVIFS